MLQYRFAKDSPSFRIAACWLTAISYILLIAHSASAVELVTDINTTYAAGGSNGITETAAVGSCTVFVMDDGVHGMELWGTDGTPAGTSLLRDIRPGAVGSEPRGLKALGAVVLFSADDGTNGVEIWRTDCTASGTAIVADIDAAGPTSGTAQGSGAINFPHAVELGGILYFPAGSLTSDYELWRTDGTRLGTWRVANINAAASSNVERLIVGGDRLFFVADDGMTGDELWSSDGTAAGTSQFVDLHPGPLGTDIREIAVVNGNVYVAGDNGVGGIDLWRGTVGSPGTMTRADVDADVDISAPTGFVPLGNDILFYAEGRRIVAGVELREVGLYISGPTGDPVFLTELRRPVKLLGVVAGRAVFLWLQFTSATGEPWTTDGTVEGTKPLLPGENFRSAAADVLVGADQLYFFAASGPSDTPEALWHTDGTPAGTYRQADVSNLPSPYAGKVGAFAYLDGAFYEAGGIPDIAEGRELWRRSGNPAQATLFKDIDPGPGSSSPNGFRIVNGKVMFIASDGVSGFEPWVTDGTQSGTMRLGDFNRNVATASSTPSGLTAFNGGVLFTADDGHTGDEPWFSDGTAAGTVALGDLAPGTAGSWSGPFTLLDDVALFSVTNAALGAELWRTDGTPGGTELLLDINPGPASSDPLMLGNAVVVESTLYFVADDGVHGDELWVSDGTPAGTRLAFDVTPGPERSSIQILGEIDGRLIFMRQDFQGHELWATDESRTTVSPIAPIFEATVDAARMQSAIYFIGRDAQGLTELWRTDGTTAGTVRVTDLNAVLYDRVMATSDRVVFNVCLAIDDCAIYGTTGVFGSEEPIVAAQAYSLPVARDSGSEIMFLAQLADGAETLLVTDGTSLGMRELVQGSVPFDGSISEFAQFQGLTVLSVVDSTLGWSIWVTDGSAGGTRLFADLDPGVDLGVGSFSVSGSKMFFAGGRADVGSELWVVDGTGPYAASDESATAFETSVRLTVLANDGDVDGVLDAASVTIVEAPSYGTASVDTATGEIDYVPSAGFSGIDTLRYTVRDDAGIESNVATVSIVVAASAGGPPGTPPAPPPTPTPTPTPVPQPSGGGGGGGGALGGELSLLVLAVLFAGFKRKRRSSM